MKVKQYKDRQIDKKGSLYRLINGIKCFIKYHVYELDDGYAECKVEVYSKIHSKPMTYIFDDIEDAEKFNVKAALRKLKIDFKQQPNLSNTTTQVTGQQGTPVSSGEPFLDTYDNVQDVYIEDYSDTVYFMTPQHIISYVYGSGVRLVKFEIKEENDNILSVTAIDPPVLINQNKQGNPITKKAFRREIDPQVLFKYLSAYDLNNQDFELTLTPIRYRQIVITSIIKQYIRENLFIGEIEVEMNSPIKNKTFNQ